MQLNLARFEELIENYAKPRWEKQIDEWELRPGGGETFIQTGVFQNASPFLAKNELEKSPKENLLKEIGANNDLSVIYGKSPESH